MLQKFQKSGIYVQARTLFPKKFGFFGIFLSITVFREIWGWKFWIFLNITVFCEVKAAKHCNAQKRIMFSQPQNSQNLSIAVFRG